MKNKIVNIIIIFFLILILLVDVVQALTMNMGIEYLVNNDELKTIIRIENLKIDENKINSISLKLNYDEKVLDLKSVDNLNGWTSQYTEQTKKITLIKLSGTSENEEICEIKFDIKDKSKLDKTEISVKDVVVSDGESESDISNVGIKIILNNNENEEKPTNIYTNTNINKNTNTNKNKIINTNINTNRNTAINTNKNTNISVNTNKNTNINKNINTNVNTNKNTNKNTNININNNTNINKNNVSLVTNKNQKNESKIQIDNQSDKITGVDRIPFAGGKTFIRIVILVLFAVAIVVYSKYKKIDKIC